jgi:hypothetical protein
MRRTYTTEEEKVAKSIAKLINNLELDIEQVGRYLARVVGRVATRRIIIIAESAKYERETQDDRKPEHTLFQEM